MSTDTQTEVTSPYEDCRSYAVLFVKSLKSMVRAKDPDIKPQELIPSLAEYVVPYLSNNELASLETSLNNATRDLTFGTRKRGSTGYSNERSYQQYPQRQSPQRQYPQRQSRETSPVVEMPANPKLARRYEQIASYVSHEMFNRQHPF